MLIFIMLFGIAYFAVILLNEERRKKHAMFISPCILILIGLCGVFLDTNFIEKIWPSLKLEPEKIIKLYPVLANFSYTVIFLTTVIYPPTLAFDIALLIDKSVKNSAAEKPMEIFCRKASIVWCVFFSVDTLLAIITLFIYPDDPEKSMNIWGLYNGLVTYLIIAVIFVSQLIKGKMIIKKFRKQGKAD